MADLLASLGCSVCQGSEWPLKNSYCLSKNSPLNISAIVHFSPKYSMALMCTLLVYLNERPLLVYLKFYRHILLQKSRAVNTQAKYTVCVRSGCGHKKWVKSQRILMARKFKKFYQKLQNPGGSYQVQTLPYSFLSASVLK